MQTHLALLHLALLAPSSLGLPPERNCEACVGQGGGPTLDAIAKKIKTEQQDAEQGEEDEEQGDEEVEKDIPNHPGAPDGISYKEALVKAVEYDALKKKFDDLYEKFLSFANLGNADSDLRPVLDLSQDDIENGSLYDSSASVDQNAEKEVDLEEDAEDKYTDKEQPVVTVTTTATPTIIPTSTKPKTTTTTTTTAGPPVGPDEVDLVSSGPAGEYLGEVLGRYTQLPGRQVWRQNSEEDVEQPWHLYRAGGHWWVWRTVGQEEGLLRAEAGPDPGPPTSGWHFWDTDLGGDWSLDGGLTAGPAGPGCGSVTLEIGGAAGTLVGLQGVFLPVPGWWSAGRQVFQQGGESGRVLAVVPGASEWSVRDPVSLPEYVDANADDPGAYLQSASAGNMCPCHPSTSQSGRWGLASWEYHDGTEFLEGDIRVACQD